MAVDVKLGVTPEIGTPQALFDLHANWVPFADGRRFLFIEPAGETPSPQDQRRAELAGGVEAVSLTAGTRLGPYEIVAPIGAGGMGEVYRAHDTKLGRDVAIKVLPESFAHDAERMARFEREAQVLASLNHPHIATIHGLEESDGIRALVMELVEGPTLAERIGHRAMPLEEALPIAKQIAEGLEYAHERGIIHRDLKPANVKLTADGNVKILDFGLAKALETPTPQGNPSISPTLTLEGTRAGVILGTAAYMAPEQARGAIVDKRADIWAFGVVLYEMLTGKQPFAGATVSDTLAAVLKTEPDWDAVPAECGGWCAGVWRKTRSGGCGTSGMRGSRWQRSAARKTRLRSPAPKATLWKVAAGLEQAVAAPGVARRRLSLPPTPPATSIGFHPRVVNRDQSPNWTHHAERIPIVFLRSCRIAGISYITHAERTAKTPVSTLQPWIQKK